MLGEVKLESSNRLSALSNSINEVRAEMEKNLWSIKSSFLSARKDWYDKNAKACESALLNHESDMRHALNDLERITNALRSLSRLAEQYENINH